MGLFYTVTSEGSSQVKECTSDPKEGAVALRNCLTGLRGGGGGGWEMTVLEGDIL